MNRDFIMKLYDAAGKAGTFKRIGALVNKCKNPINMCKNICFLCYVAAQHVIFAVYLYIFV